MTQESDPSLMHLRPWLVLAQMEGQRPSPEPQPESSGGGVFSFGLSLFILLLLLLVVLKKVLRICKPNEILIISGRQHRQPDGHSVGYRVLFGGRTITIPILETVKRMDVTTIPTPISVKNAYARGGTPLNIQAIANIKVSTDPALVGNAIERFLDRSRDEICRVARENLEGNLRSVVATLTPEQVNEDRLKFAERIAQDVGNDLAKLGLQLDTFKIQSVSDDVDYLKSIGRQRIAQMMRDAEIAEAVAVGEAERREAEAQQRAQVAKTQTLTIIQQKQNELRKITAELEQQARSEEERTTAAAKEARARAEQTLQALRTELERLRLEADVVLPAQTAQQAETLMARGASARLEANAKATAEVGDRLTQLWQSAGSDAAQVFLLQQLELILAEAAQIPSRIHLGHIKLIDKGDGQALSGLSDAYPAMVQQFLQRVEQTLGISLLSASAHPTSIQER
jgi:flotillin